LNFPEIFEIFFSFGGDIENEKSAVIGIEMGRPILVAADDQMFETVDPISIFSFGFDSVI